MTMQNNSIAIRHAEINDLNELSDLENRCFLPAEACNKEHMKQRLEIYPDFFFLHEENGKIVSFVDGLLSRDIDLKDEMYEDAHMHNPDGTWLMILGVNTDPQFRNHKFASACIRASMLQCKEEGRYGAVLTCKKALIPFYEKNGFLSEGISASVHGNVTWYQMRSVFIPGKMETEHLVLRKAEKKDADALYEHVLRFEESSQFMDWKTCMNPEDSRKWLEEFQKESEKDNRMQYVVDEKEGDTCIGFAGIGYEGMRTFEEHGIALGPEWCGKHYGGEILDAFLEYSLGKCRSEKFVYGCLKKNTPSAHLAESRGFVLKREDNLHFQKDDSDNPHLVFERDGKDYRSSRNGDKLNQ